MSGPFDFEPCFLPNPLDTGLEIVVEYPLRRGEGPCGLGTRVEVAGQRPPDRQCQSVQQADLSFWYKGRRYDGFGRVFFSVATGVRYRSTSLAIRLKIRPPSAVTVDDRTKREIIRCLKCFLARELYQRVMTDFRMRQRGTEAA